jgi:hypothetical protein
MDSTASATAALPIVQTTTVRSVAPPAISV